MAKSTGSADAFPGAPRTPDEGDARRPDDLLGLARAAATRDPAAAETLLAQVGGVILTTVRQVLGSQHPDVEDVAQDSAIAFLRSLGDFRGDCSTRRYAQRVALFTALSTRRKLIAQSRLLDSEQPLESRPTDENINPLSEAMASRRRQTLRKVLDGLPDVIAEALALHFILGYSVDEIAQACSSPANTIWSRLRLGKQAFRKIMRDNKDLAELFEVKE